MITGTKLIFFGNSTHSLPALKTLFDAKIPLMVVTSPDKPAGRHLVLTPNPVKDFAIKNQLAVIESTTELISYLSKVDEDKLSPVGLIAAYGKIIKPPVLEKFSGRLYNLHPSLLPLYRGPSPLQTQIIDQVKTTGITVIQVDEQVDHGPIIRQEDFVLEPEDTPETLGERLFTRGTKLFLEFLNQSENYPLKDQDHTKASFTHMLTRQDGFMPYADFVSKVKSKDPDILVKFRAYFPWPGVWTTDKNNKRIKLVAVKPEILIQPEGKSPTPLQSLPHL